MKIIIAGDFSPRYELNKIIDTGNYALLFDEIIPYISISDYAIVNFETVIPTLDSKPIRKCGPNLRTSAHAVDAIKYAGFNIVTIANNHVYDFGDAGLEYTLNILKDKGVNYVGAGKNLNEASRILVLEKGDIKVALINCCEHEFSIVTDEHCGCNPINPIHQYYDIKKAKDECDYVVVIVHGGHEHFQLPSLRMQEAYRFFIDAGADVVVNHHQHCYSGMEEYNGKYIFYGLGNFLFDKKRGEYTENWCSGFLLQLNFEEHEIKFEVIPYKQCLNSPRVQPLKNHNDISDFETNFNRLNEIISSPDMLRNEIDNFYSNIADKDILVSFEPYSNRYLKAAYYRKLIPPFFKGKKLVRLLNILECESHNDIARYLLKKKLDS